MKFRVLKFVFLLAAPFLSGQAQEKPEAPQVTLPPAATSIPEFSSRKMDLAQCVALALEWEPVLESAGMPELFMLWLDRAGPEGQGRE